MLTLQSNRDIINLQENTGQMISLQEENTGHTTTARQRLAQSSSEETNTYASVKLPFIAPNLQTLVLSRVMRLVLSFPINSSFWKQNGL